MSVLEKRLKEARLSAGLSQEKLGIDAGLEEASAGVRINRYEKGARAPNFELVQRLGQVLNLPAAYFYAEDDETAWLLMTLHRMPEAQRRNVLEYARKAEK